jgi:hypothetical protein
MSASNGTLRATWANTLLFSILLVDTDGTARMLSAISITYPAAVLTKIVASSFAIFKYNFNLSSGN